MPEELTEVEKLQDVIDTLPDRNDHTGNERREYSLTKGDVLLIYKIATIANKPHVCPFEQEETQTLNMVAKNINRTQKIAAGIVITGVTMSVLAGVWMAIKHFFLEWVKQGVIK